MLQDWRLRSSFLKHPNPRGGAFESLMILGTIVVGMGFHTVGRTAHAAVHLQCDCFLALTEFIREDCLRRKRCESDAVLGFRMQGFGEFVVGPFQVFEMN